MIIISGSAESTGSGEGWVVVGDSHQGGDDDHHDDDDDDDDDGDDGDDDGGDKSGEGWVLVGESQPGVLPRNLHLLLLYIHTLNPCSYISFKYKVIIFKENMPCLISSSFRWSTRNRRRRPVEELFLRSASPW